MTNPLQGHFRATKLYTKIPSLGKFYTPDIVEMNETGELAVRALTAKDELFLKNPDALLNGEAVSEIIKSCVPQVKQPRKLLSNDVDILLIAIQGATYGDDVEVKGNCDKCETEATGFVSVEAALETMKVLEESYTFTIDGLFIEVRPYSYESAVKAGISSFRSTRSLQAIAAIEDDLQRLHAFNESFIELATLNFELIVDSIASIEILDTKEVVTDPQFIREFLENADNTIGRAIEEKIRLINDIGIDMKVQMKCEECSIPADEGFDECDACIFEPGGEADPNCKTCGGTGTLQVRDPVEGEDYLFESPVNFDPVNFFTAS